MIKKRPNLILLAFICLLVMVDILFLRPTQIDTHEEEPQGMATNIQDVVQAQKEKDEVGYNIEGFHYTSVTGEQRDWELIADNAVLYEKSQQVLADHARIKSFDPEGKITLILGDHAYYHLGKKDLDLEGHVTVTFPDGFWIKTTKAHYSSLQDRITSSEPFTGQTMPDKDGVIDLSGIGFVASKTSPDVYVLKDSRVKHHNFEKEEMSDVHSDRARIDRFKRVAFFSMVLPQGYVESHQGTLYVRSKRQEATYDPNAKTLNYLTAYEDVLIEETDKVKAETGLKYATCQKADFLPKADKILLFGFPSVYQKYDTLTGDKITVYRKKNIVEVEQANAYHEGKSDH